MRWFGRPWPWALEVCSLIASVIQVAAVVVICLYFNGKSIINQPTVTLNTIIAILSTGSKATLLTAVAGCISQANWFLFSDSPRRLYDFEMVSDASRGPLGSVQLLGSSKFKGGLTVRFGALITILTIAMDPFAQQLIQLHQTERRADGGTFPRALTYSLGILNEKSGSNRELITSYSADIGMQAAVAFGLTSETRDIEKQTSYDCPGNHCEYKNIVSMAVCSKCVDVDHELKEIKRSDGRVYMPYTKSMGGGDLQWGVGGDKVTEYRLPNGLYMNGMDGDQSWPLCNMTLFGTSNPNKTIAAKELSSLIWSQSIIKMDGKEKADVVWPNFKLHATECSLYYCVKEYSFETRNATIHETSSKVLTEYKRNPDSWKYWSHVFDPNGVLTPPQEQWQSLAFHPNYSYHNRDDFQLSSNLEGDETFNITQNGINSISTFVQTFFSAQREEQKNRTTVVDDWKPPTGYRSWTKKSYPESAQVIWDTTDVSKTFDNIAMSMSNALRAGDKSEKAATGVVLNPVTIYRIRWPWIALHIFLEAAALLFFILTQMYRYPTGGKIPTWKSSEIAVLAKGTALPDMFRDITSLQEFEKQAKQTRLVLLGNVADDYPKDVDSLYMSPR